VADYPFTTLTPHLGVVGDADEEFVLADVPGLISGAHQGSGLGHRFLRHLLRTRFLVYFIDVSEASERDPVEDFRTLREEVQQYGHGLERLPATVAANKIDILYDDERATRLGEAAQEAGMEFWKISAATGKGTQHLIRRLSLKLRETDLETPAGEVL
jgi:GTP-binding protein